MTHDDDMEPVGIDKGWARQMLGKSIGMSKDQLIVFFVAYLLYAAGDGIQPYGDAGDNRDLWLRKLHLYTGLPVKRVENVWQTFGEKVPRF